jgi:GNAT superfamily N-acetyltransferase
LHCRSTFRCDCFAAEAAPTGAHYQKQKSSPTSAPAGIEVRAAPHCFVRLHKGRPVSGICLDTQSPASYIRLIPMRLSINIIIFGDTFFRSRFRQAIMGLAVAVKKICRNFRDYGLGTTAAKGLRYVARPLFERTTYRVYAIDLQGLTVAPAAAGDGLAFHIVRPGDAALIKQIGEAEEWLAGVLAAKLSNNGLCVAALHGSTLAGFNLIAFGEVYLPLVKLHKQLQPDEAWSEQISVGKEYRRQGLAANIRYCTFRELQSRGIARLYGATLVSNSASLKLARRVGFRDIEEIQYRSILGHRTWQYRKTG